MLGLMMLVFFYRILANRITELENTLDSWCNGQKCIPIFPSQMLLEEIITDTGSIKSDESKDKNETEQNRRMKNRYSDSDDEQNKSNHDSSSTELRYNYNEGGDGDNRNITSKTVLPEELEQLVREALAEMKSAE